MSITLKKVFTVYVFALAFLFASRPISDPDLWFHLATGRYILLNGSVPHVDTFSCTNPGQPYIAHGWLSDILLYLIYSRIGPNLLIFLFALFTTIAFWFLFNRSDDHIFVRGLALLLGVWTVLPNIGVRPRVFTLLIFAAYFVILTEYLRQARPRYLFWLVPLMVLWVNLHGGFLLGLTMIALAIVGTFLDSRFAQESPDETLSRIRPLALTLIVCALAALLNPYGVKIYSYIFGVLSAPEYQEVVLDWLPPDFHQSEQLPLIILILVTVSVMALSPKRVRPSELLFFLATLYMTLKMQRNAMIFAIVASSLLADYGGPLWNVVFRQAKEQPFWSRTGVRQSVLNILLLLPLLLFGVKLKNLVYREPTQQMAGVPFSATQYLKDKGLTGCTFTDGNVWGAYLIWAAPENPVYIDGRDMYPTAFVKEYVQIIRGRKDWREAFQQYGVKNAILSRSSILATQLKESPEWQKVFEDDYSIVFSLR